MKRLLILALATTLFCSAAVANATEFRASGQFDFTAENLAGDAALNSEGVDVLQRFRTQIEMIASENLSGVVYFEIGDITWGKGDAVGRGSGGKIGADGVNVETRRAYIDFMIPNSALNIRTGLMGVCLPNAVAGSPVFDDDVAAAIASYNINDTVSIAAFFARPYDEESIVSVGDEDFERENQLDMFGLLGNVDFGNVSISPYAVFANGKYYEANTDRTLEDRVLFDDDVNITWVGAAIVATPMENLKLGADAIYSYADFEKDDMDGEGFFVAGFVSYNLEAVTPKLTAWWSEGSDDDDLGFVGLAGSFTPTSFGFDDGTGRSSSCQFSDDGVETAGIALSFEDISFINSVTHKAVFAYMEKTNDANEDDSAFEIDFITEYQMYEDLSATLELAYFMPDYDDSEDMDNIFKTAVSLKYAF